MSKLSFFLAIDMKFPYLGCYIFDFRKGEISCLNWAFGIWHEISPSVDYFGFIWLFLKIGESKCQMPAHIVLSGVWHEISPPIVLAFFGIFSIREISCQLPDNSILAGIWHENSPLKVWACVSADSQFWIFWKWGIYCQIPADKKEQHIVTWTLFTVASV